MFYEENINVTDKNNFFEKLNYIKKLIHLKKISMELISDLDLKSEFKCIFSCFIPSKKLYVILVCAMCYDYYM